jgi:hypothetical protein
MQANNIVLVDVKLLGFVDAYCEIVSKVFPDHETAQEFYIVAALEWMIACSVVPVRVAECDQEKRRKQTANKPHNAQQARVVEHDEQIRAHCHLLHHIIVLANHVQVLSEKHDKKKRL